VVESRPQDALPEIGRVQNDGLRSFLYATAYYALGQQKQSDAALQELITKHGAHDAFDIAMVYAFRNQRDEAFEWLEQAYARRDGDVCATNLEPMLMNLHSDPRYAAFLKKIHLPAT
jgi:hypothetical protein